MDGSVGDRRGRYVHPKCVRVSLIEPGNYGTEIGRNVIARMDTSIVKGSCFEAQLRSTVSAMWASRIIVQLNDSQKFRYDREALVKLLDEAIARTKQTR